MKLENKVVWITGASSGIGKSLALELQGAGCKLILSARRTELLNEVKQQCRATDHIAVLPLDLANHDQMPQIVEKAISQFGHIDVLVNNAGISQRSLIAETDFSVYKTLIDINYLGTVALTKALLPHFISRKTGHYATITSLMGKFGSPYRSGYCGAKHALHGFFDVLRMEHQKDNINVTLICPGFVKTPVSIHALTGDGSSQNKDDEATANGLDSKLVAKKIVRAISRKKFEVYFGKIEVAGIYLKRFFPKLLHTVVLRSKVR